MQWSETRLPETSDDHPGQGSAASPPGASVCADHIHSEPGATAAGPCGPEDCHSAGCHQETHEPCPSPLGWAEVLERYDAESDSFELRRPRSVLRVRAWGEGAPLYLLPGFFETAELYALALYVLKDQFRCVVFDRVEDRRAAPIELADLAGDLFAVADEMNNDQFALYAASAASLTALTALLDQPGRIERAILQGGFAHRRLSAFERTAVRLGRLAPGRLKHLPLRRAIALQNHRPWFPPFDHSRFEFCLNATGEIPLSNAAARADHVRRTDLRPRLAEIRSPVLLLRTEGDGTISARAQDELASRLPNAAETYLDNCGQLPCLTHPHRTAKAITAFLLPSEEPTCPEPATAAPGTVTT